MPNPQDGRGVIVRLTARGLMRVDAALADHVARQARLVAAIAPADRDRLAVLLRDWLGEFERHDATSAGASAGIPDGRRVRGAAADDKGGNQRDPRRRR